MIQDLRPAIPRTPFLDSTGYVSREWVRFFNDLCGLLATQAAPRLEGYDAPTGTADRTAFDTATVTLPELAERVKAVIDDIKTV